MIQKIRLSIGMSVMFLGLLAAYAGAYIADRRVAAEFSSLLKRGARG